MTEIVPTQSAAAQTSDIEALATELFGHTGVSPSGFGDVLIEARDALIEVVQGGVRLSYVDGELVADHRFVHAPRGEIGHLLTGAVTQLETLQRTLPLAGERTYMDHVVASALDELGLSVDSLPTSES